MTQQEHTATDDQKTPASDEVNVAERNATDSTDQKVDEKKTDEPKEVDLSFLDSKETKKEKQISEKQRKQDRSTVQVKTIENQASKVLEKMNDGLSLEEALDEIPKSLQWTRDEVEASLSPKQKSAPQIDIDALIEKKLEEKMKKQTSKDSAQAFKVALENYAYGDHNAIAKEAKKLYESHPSLNGDELARFAAINAGAKMLSKSDIEAKRKNAALYGSELGSENKDPVDDITEENIDKMSLEQLEALRVKKMRS